jgi:hypothetical protein
MRGYGISAFLIFQSKSQFWRTVWPGGGIRDHWLMRYPVAAG